MRKNGAKFIVFEGIDGCGKSTQVDILTKALNNKGISAYATREPQRDRAVGKVLRSILTREQVADPKVTAMLFAADRIDHITGDNGINALLSRGITVVCDRYYFSNFAYNNEGVDVEWVESLNRMAMEICKPDVHIFVDTPVEVALSRMGNRSSTELYETKEKLESVRGNFLKLFEKYKDKENVKVIDGRKSISEISKEVMKIIENL